MGLLIWRMISLASGTCSGFLWVSSLHSPLYILYILRTIMAFAAWPLSFRFFCH
jgi:hypothetical protein